MFSGPVMLRFCYYLRLKRSYKCYSYDVLNAANDHTSIGTIFLLGGSRIAILLRSVPVNFFYASFIQTYSTSKRIHD